MESSNDWILTLGAVDFSPSAQFDGDLRVSVHGFRRGKPVPVVQVVESMLRDGANERVDRYDNRDLAIVVGIEGDVGSMDDFERTLWLEMQRPSNVLTWKPPSAFGVRGLYDVLWSDLEFSEADDWDLDELRGKRVYSITLRTAPFPRSADEIVAQALTTAASPSTVVVSDGTSTAGWIAYTQSPSSPRTLTSTSGYLATSFEGGAFTEMGSTTQVVSVVNFEYNTATPVDFSQTNYLTLDFAEVSYAGATSQTTEVRVWADGLLLTQLATVSETTNGTRWRRGTWLCSDASVTKVRVEVRSTTYFPTGGTITANANTVPAIDRLARTNVPPSVGGNGFQSLRTVEIGGSARTEATLAVAHPTKSLADLLIYTAPQLASGYAPNMQKWRTSPTANVTSSAFTMSGFEQTVAANAKLTFQVPVSLLPAGTYVMMVRAYDTASSAPFSWRAVTKVGTAEFSAQTGTSQVPVATTYTLSTVGTMELPPAKAGGAATVQVELSRATSWVFDEAWLFYMGPDAALTRVATGSTAAPSVGVAHNRLWMDPPTIDSPTPGLYVGTTSDRQDSIFYGENANWALHEFKPPSSLVFVASTNATYTEVTVRHTPRWFQHPAA